MKIYRCAICGNIAVKLTDSGVDMVCCNEVMKELVAGTVDAAAEKHVPEVKIEGDDIHVVVGEVIHPMIPEHYIEWILVETEKSFAVKFLKAGEEPKASFNMKGEKVVAVYEYCNLHGLWKSA